jgi:hypothetical protein
MMRAKSPPSSLPADECKMSRRKQIAEFVRMPKTVHMAVGDLKVDETAQTDEQFVGLYSKYLTGKLRDVRSRIDIRTIVPGFFRVNQQGSYENVGLEYNERALESEIRNIRFGFRPPIFLYKAFVGPAKNKLICSDDLLALHAYRKLGIRYVPAVILGKHPECLQESGICTRGVPKTGTSIFDSVIVHEHAFVPSLAGDLDSFEDQDFTEVVRTLSRSVGSTKDAIATFHQLSGETTIHYHHTLYSVLCSLEQLLRAVELLLSNDLEHQIRPLVRSAYDLFLNFYIDWLYPEKMGALFQALAVLGRTDKSRPEYISLNDAIRGTFGGLVDILMNQSEKGRISPFGSKVHQAIYSGLSPSVHQDFGVTQEFGDSLESGVIEPLPRSELASTLKYLNIVVSATIIRIADDVGVQLDAKT